MWGKEYKLCYWILNCVKVKTRKSKTYESFTFIVPCDRLLPIYTMERTWTSYTHSTNAVTPRFLVLETKGSVYNIVRDNIRPFPCELQFAYWVGVLFSFEDNVSDLNVLQRNLLVSPFWCPLDTSADLQLRQACQSLPGLCPLLRSHESSPSKLWHSHWLVLLDTWLRLHTTAWMGWIW
jgi:hypothetical protein